MKKKLKKQKLEKQWREAKDRGNQKLVRNKNSRGKCSKKQKL